MNKLLTLVCALALAVVARADGDFTRTLTPAERAAAGLDKLTPAELARLQALVERYKTGEVAAVQRQAEAQVAATAAQAQAAEQKAAATQAQVQAAEQKVAVAEAKVREAEARTAATPEAEARKKGPGWLRALVTLEKVGKQPEKAEALESRLAGEFTGWQRNTVFVLENGQRWQCTDSNAYVTPPMPAPRVKIYPGLLGSYWMELEGVRSRARVKPLKLD